MLLGVALAHLPGNNPPPIVQDRRHRQWTQVHESIMEKFVELCVELKNSIYAKDGLYQYKQITQQVGWLYAD